MKDIKITNIKVEVRRSYDYNSFGMELSADLLDDTEENITNAKQYLWTMANTECNMQIIGYKKLKKLEKEQEVIKKQRNETLIKKQDILKLETKPKKFKVF